MTSSGWFSRPPGTAVASPDHVLLSGPPDLGKTTLAMIIASEISAPLRISSGPAIQHAGDLAAILSGLAEGEVFFLDEIHRMSRPAEEMLYLAMEDFRIDVMVGKGPERRPSHWRSHDSPWWAPPPGPGCCRSRFATGSGSPRNSTSTTRRRWSTSCTAHPNSSAPTRDAAALSRSPAVPAARRGSPTGCSAGFATSPRCAPTAGHKPIAEAALELYGSTSWASTGSTAPSWMRCAVRFGGGPVGLSTLAISVGEERETVEEVAEPFLVRQGFLMRTQRGPRGHRQQRGGTSG